MWTDIFPIVIRQLINDTASPYRYSDSRLEDLTIVSAVFVIRDVEFSTSYTIDINNSTITPDPSSDNDFIALVSLRVACMILSGEFTTASDKGIIVKDGPSMIDMSKMIDAKKQLAETACKNYDKARTNYVYGDGSFGRAIVTPFRIYDDEQNILS